MAGYSPVVVNAVDSVIRDLSGSGRWLQTISNDAGLADDIEVQIGTNTINVIDEMTSVTIANKTGTSIIADKGVSHTKTLTTVQEFLPIKFTHAEMAIMRRLGNAQSEVEKLTKKGIDGIFKAAAATIVDALVALTLPNTGTLDAGNMNFGASTEAKALSNMQVLGGVWGTAAGDNDGDPPDWIIATPIAYGKIQGYSNNFRSAGLNLSPDGKNLNYNGTKLWAQPNGTEFGDASKQCVFMGMNKHIVFRANAVNQPTNGEIIYQDGTDLWVLPISITFTYGVDATSTVGLALKIGEINNDSS